jgi:hypothetical protein
MRTRIRPASLHQSGRRRPHDDEHFALQLQRTIGNRATTRLLREPTVAEDVAAERARFDQAAKEHEQRLAEYRQRAQPHVLKANGITTDSKVDDGTPSMIQAALAESLKLRPYLRGKFPALSITKGFAIHAVEDDFNTAAAEHFNDTTVKTKDERAAKYGKIGGFYDRRHHRIVVRTRTKFGHAVHESMHRVSHPGFRGFFGDFINEGVTQLMADCLLEEQGLSVVTDHDYGKQLECAKKLVAATNFDTVARAYFYNDTALRQALIRRFQLKDILALQKMMSSLCSRL